MDCKKQTYKISNIISSFILIISYAFVMAQSIINIKYNENNDNDIIAERLVYEQFSHEVYTNINSKVIKNITFVDINEDCPDNFRIMNIPIKMESFYDCPKIDKNNENIEKEYFENRITSAQTCSRKGCCLKRISDKKENAYCMDKNNIDEYDIRKELCTKFSKYNGRFYNYENKKICVEKDYRNYEDLLLEQSSKCSSNTIYFDSYDHCVNNNNDNNYNYLTNNGKAIVKNIFSIDDPNYFEMESSIRINKLLNKIKYDEEKIKKEYDKISRISPKDIYDAFMDTECKYCNDNNYKIYKSTSTKLNNIFTNSSEIIFDNYRYNSYIGNSDISWYTRNYIGFNNKTELNKFKKYFDSNDYKNNPLYKISSDLYPNYGSAIIGSIIFIVSIAFIVLLIKNFKNEENDYKIKDFNLNNIRFLLVFILFLTYLIMYLIHLGQFDEIYIDMELFYKKVIEKYNQRRKQIYLLIGVILFSFNLFIELLIQNLKCDISLRVEEGANGPQVNSINVILKLKESTCEKKHHFKFYKNKKFSEHLKKIKALLSRCNKCKECDVDDFYYNDKIIEIDNKVKDINIKNNSEIIIE